MFTNHNILTNNISEQKRPWNSSGPTLPNLLCVIAFVESDNFCKTLWDKWRRILRVGGYWLGAPSSLPRAEGISILRHQLGRPTSGQSLNFAGKEGSLLKIIQLQSHSWSRMSFECLSLFMLLWLQCFSKYGPQTSSFSATWELVQRRIFKPHPGPTKSDTGGVRPGTLCLNTPSRWFWGSLKFENHMGIYTNSLSFCELQG